ncbi:NAD(P)-dependent dehydrogenase (short-subunit alcohol dehydrogenase family) [Sphingobium wenxiniae]|uniref:NAD(P)-dependent dehydrogenase (Short-subunit alcohol dehydrogenase family) n=1 Tax=Sphingobium wenxiniae (strain DSM 21828 / CGMCC 1.7748 / JZ-1) TaxID=595605 RepID=A0A562KKP3_SPHWJ|nr:SDR family NAD(P)-dependent oxidoreductase [Sphingobium baderi]TWH95914.1 NAD(P)-dependent dehydrogenase (short-subunit alcohol dehydrogenase family) [Sphingobium wenxiniae]WRD77546.1 SDR family NAD(P)-dependent oxidoreductase [Sphingobium baderi]
MDLGLSGKQALVTGSSAGIGLAIARTLAAEGVRVCIHGRDAARCTAIVEDVVANGGSATMVVADVDADGAPARIADAALGQLGAVDILVNNVGGRVRSGMSVDWFAIPPALWTETYARNVTFAVELIHRLAGPMRTRRWGRIINVASVVATHPSGGVGEYSAAKNGLVNLSLGLSKALAGSGVTVNSVSPGLIQTGAADKWLAATARDRGFGDDLKAAEQWVLANSLRQTVHRWGMPQDIAYAVCMLASPSADFLNGINLHVDGGATQAVH